MTQNKHAVLIYDENRYSCTVSFMDGEAALQSQAILVGISFGKRMGIERKLWECTRLRNGGLKLEPATAIAG
jgi:hypothetical protein